MFAPNISKRFLHLAPLHSHIPPHGEAFPGQDVFVLKSEIPGPSVLAAEDLLLGNRASKKFSQETAVLEPKMVIKAGKLFGSILFHADKTVAAQVASHRKEVGQKQMELLRKRSVCI